MKKDKYINIRVTDEQKQELEQLAKENHMTVSEYVLYTALHFNLGERITAMEKTVRSLANTES